MKKLVIFAFLVAVFASNVSAAVGMDNKDVTGEWKYEVPTAPYGYEKGVLVLSEKEGKLAGQVKFEDGYKIELKNITYTEGTLKCGLYVDYEYVSIKAKIDGKKLTGAVASPEGEMKITASKVK
ncbi:MAG: hypothetical protein HQ522_01265 [Bacteroidetes bacterium]|nr:hypothetical protein [Bacteroidota bacterium]